MLDDHQPSHSRRRQDVAILRFNGDLDSHRAAEVRGAFADVPVGGMAVIVLTEVPFIDSAGLGALIGGIRRIREADGDAVVCGAGPGVARVLTVSGVDRFVRLECDLDAAIISLDSPMGASNRSVPARP